MAYSEFAKVSAELVLDHAVTDHAAASADMLRHFADRLERGESGFDMGKELVLVARMIARRT